MEKKTHNQKNKSRKYGFEDITCVAYQKDFLPDPLSKNAMENIIREVEFNTDEESAIKVMGKKIKIPRKQAGYGDPNTSYHFTGVHVKAKEWSPEKTPALWSIKEHITKQLGYPVNYVLINLYQNGSDYIGYHSDDERDLDTKYPSSRLA
jgi:alkylated DNA repair dioxygenase AlkB